MASGIRFSALHSHTDHSHSEHSALSEFLSAHLGAFGEFLDSVVLHAVIEVLKMLPFLFLTYLLMEFIEHKAGDKTVAIMKKSGRFGPLIGSAGGLLPQCGFSAVAANLFCGRVVSLGTLVAVFLATSDEMLPLLIGNPDIKLGTVALILLYKFAVGVLIGFAVDLALHLMKRDGEKINIDELCDNDNCHCERGILHSAIHHTVSISLFILITTAVINTAIFFIGDEAIASLMYDKPIISHLICALVGLIPNCAVSVTLTGFYTSGFITAGSMLAGLFSGAGVGLLVLFRVNKHIKENLAVVGIITASGFLFGLLADVIGIFA